MFFSEEKTFFSKKNGSLPEKDLTFSSFKVNIGGMETGTETGQH